MKESQAAEASATMAQAIFEVFKKKVVQQEPGIVGATRLTKRELLGLARVMIPLLPILADEFELQFEERETAHLARALAQDLSIWQDIEFTEKAD